MTSYLLSLYGHNSRILYQEIDRQGFDSDLKRGISKKIEDANRIVPTPALLKEDHYSVEKNSNSVIGRLARLTSKYREESTETD